MTSPARAGVYLYAKDLARLAAFYEAVLGMQAVRHSEELAVLDPPDVQLVVHAIPPAIAELIATNGRGAGLHITCLRRQNQWQRFAKATSLSWSSWMCRSAW
jgi:catechol 2,3-dioxygenase-like lactoylglutathione lyase family enzyme